MQALLQPIRSKALAFFTLVLLLNACSLSGGPRTSMPGTAETAGSTTTAAGQSTGIVAVASSLPAPIETELRRIGSIVAPPATAPLFASAQTPEPYAGVRVTRDQAYGSDARHRLDVFNSAGSGGPTRTVLLFVHGGAFTAGNKRTGTSPFYDNIMLWAVRAGMVGVNMTYRLAPQHAWPAAQADIADAIRWIRTNIGQYGGRADRIVLMGHSAGAAHVAQYLGHPQFHVAPGSGVAGALLISGIFDTTTAQANPPLQAYFGRDPALYADRSALPGMTRLGVPILLAYAELDPPDFHRQSEQAHAELCRAGRCPTTLKLMGHSHMSEIYSINTEDRALTDHLVSFIKRL